MEATAEVRPHAKIVLLLTVTLLVTSLGTTQDRGKHGNSEPNSNRKSGASEVIVVQGRVAAIEGALITVKMPDDYPGGPGGHAQFVTAGPTYRVDISRARFLLPDGKREDKKPLAVGDRVLLVLTGPVSIQPVPGNLNVGPPYLASVVERVVQSDTIATH